MKNNLLPCALAALCTATVAMALTLSADQLHTEHNGIVLNDMPEPSDSELVSALH